MSKHLGHQQNYQTRGEVKNPRRRDFIQAYGKKPIPVFTKNSDGETIKDCFMGIELEVGKGGVSESNAKKILELGNGSLEHEDFLYIKHDCSIHPVNSRTPDGFEVISHPMSYFYHIRKFPWKEVMEKLNELGYIGHDRAGLGIHVHVSRLAFGDDPNTQAVNIAKFMYLVNKFWDKIVVFTRRNQSELQQWSKRYPETYGFAEFESIARSRYYEDKYICVNLKHAHTIELRIFRSTLNYESFLAILQLIYRLVFTCVKKTHEQVQRMSWKRIGGRMSCKKFPYLKNYLERKNLLDLD